MGASSSFEVPRVSELLKMLVSVGARISDCTEVYPDVTDIYFDAKGIEAWAACSSRAAECFLLFGPDYRVENLEVAELVDLVGKLVNRDFDSKVRLRWPMRSVSLKFRLRGEELVISRTSIRPLSDWEAGK